MNRAEVTGATLLSTDRLGETERVREILAGWGMDRQAIARLLREHRARLAEQARGAEALPGPVVLAAGPGGAPQGAHAR